MSVATAEKLNEQRFLLQNVSWDFYEYLLNELDDRPVHLTYDRGNLEFMAPSYRHENYSSALGRFVMILCEELASAFKSGRSTTFRREDLDRGLEPDDCFYIRSVRKILGKSEIDLTVDPPPDLAIEIDISRSSLDRMGIYAALGVPEVWRFDGRTLVACCLMPDGEYEERAESPTFPMVPLRRIVDFLRQSTDSDDMTSNRKFRAWVRKQIVTHKRKHRAN